MPDALAIFITFITMVFIAPLVMIKHINQYFLSVKSMLGINTEFIPAVISNFNMVFSNPQLKLNVILFIASFIIVFCFKNTNELSEKYVKSNNSFYTIILAVIFIISALSITKRSEFIYFNF